MDFIIRLLLNTVAVMITAYLLKGVTVKNFLSALFVAILLGIVNAIIKPILVILTIPITILTLGLFILVINALLIKLVDVLVPGFSVKNFGWAILFSIVLWLVNTVINWVF